jgi:hypothetical protein
MSFIDVMIPGVAGILLLVAPDIFLGKSITGETRKSRLAKLRGIGVVLLAVAALYASLSVFKKS